MKRLALSIIVISLLFVSCNKDIKQALNMPGSKDSVKTDTSSVKTDDSSTMCVSEKENEYSTDNAETQINDNLSVNVGEKVYKEVSVNGKTISKWLIVSDITEYDIKGAEILYHESSNCLKMEEVSIENFLEEICEGYDDKNYDNKGNLIYVKSSVGDEIWYEYDNKGNKIHFKTSTGYEGWWKYDSKGNIIYYKNSLGNEEWYEYDNKGNKIHSKDNRGYEEWCEYDSKGNEIHYKDSKGYEEWTEYIFRIDGTKKRRIVYRSSNYPVKMIHH